MDGAIFPDLGVVTDVDREVERSPARSASEVPSTSHSPEPGAKTTPKETVPAR